MSVRLGRFMECRGVLPTTQFACWKGLGPCDSLLCVAHTLQNALEMGQKARIVQIDFSAAFAWSTIRGFSSISVLWELDLQFCFCVVFRTVVAVERPSRRLYRRRLFLPT